LDVVVVDGIVEVVTARLVVVTEGTVHSFEVVDDGMPSAGMEVAASIGESNVTAERSDLSAPASLSAGEPASTFTERPGSC
jgi:hypothetical protein